MMPNTDSAGDCCTHCRQLLKRTALKDCTVAPSSPDSSPSLILTLIVCFTAPIKVGGLVDSVSVGCPATTAWIRDCTDPRPHAVCAHVPLGAAVMRESSPGAGPAHTGSPPLQAGLPHTADTGQQTTHKTAPGGHLRSHQHWKVVRDKTPRQCGGGSLT